jgi:DNA polymerase elongation subunit (family B)
LKQRVLVLDIETAPLEAYVWGLKDQNIGLSQIKTDWHVMAWSAKWLDAPVSEMVYRDLRHGPKGNDRRLLLEMHKLLDEADIVLTQNGKEFDAKKLNARFIYHGIKPPSPYRHLDTYLIIKSVAAFTSNKLEYLTSKLCTKYKKLTHGKFPGMSLWIECLNGNLQAWNEMRRYNIQDVLSLEEFYNKIKAWAPKNAPRVYEEQAQCRMCGSTTERRGFNHNRTKYRIVCKSATCGAWGSLPVPKERKQR